MRIIKSIGSKRSSRDLRYAPPAGPGRLRPLSAALAAGFLVLTGPGAAGAASILNEDSKAHVVMVTDGRFRNEMQLGPGEAATEVCAKCRFDVQNVGGIDAQDNDVVVITPGGGLEKRS